MVQCYVLRWLDIYSHRLDTGLGEKASKCFKAVQKTFPSVTLFSNEDAGDLQSHIDNMVISSVHHAIRNAEEIRYILP